MTQADVADYYDGYARIFLRDISGGNARVAAVHQLYREAIHPDTRSILLIGCGSGKDAAVLARDIAPRTQVVAVDISSNNIRMAQALFAHPRITYRQADATQDVVEGTFDVIVFPDVYEHIPTARRGALHERLAACLSPDGQVLLTCPTRWHQDSLREAGEGLQIVDEDVTLEDVQALARDLGGFVSLFRVVSIWRANDYFHAIVDRRPGTYDKSTRHAVSIRAHPTRSALAQAWERTYEATKLKSVVHRVRRWYYVRKLKQAQVRVDADA